jgi:hypothetical protein
MGDCVDTNANGKARGRGMREEEGSTGCGGERHQEMRQEVQLCSQPPPAAKAFQFTGR